MESNSELAKRALGGDEKAEAKLVWQIRAGHTRSGASSMLYCRPDGRKVRSFADAMRAWADWE